MPAHNEEFPWMSYYGHYDFFEQRMSEHSSVKTLERLEKNLYLLNTTFADGLRLFICECYSFGMAEYTETVQNLGKLDVIIIDSTWCKYTDEAKKHCRNNGVGLFDIKGFMAALNLPEFWMYLNRDEAKRKWD